MTLPSCVRETHNWWEHQGGKSFTCADCGLRVAVGKRGYEYMNPGYGTIGHRYTVRCADGGHYHFLMVEGRIRARGSSRINIDCRNCDFRLVLHTHLTMATQDKPAKSGDDAA